MTAATEELSETIASYNAAWNAHDVERIGSMHAPAQGRLLGLGAVMRQVGLL